MSDIKNPRESLASYFDELLAEPSWQAPAVAPIQKVAPSLMREVALGAGELPAVPDHTQRLEKLLQSAHHQLWQTPLPKVDQPKPVFQEIQSQEIQNKEIQGWEIQEWEVQPAALPLAEPIAPVPAPELPPHHPPEAERHASQLDAVEWLDNGLPAWAQTRFDVLLFGVSGLTLAVPLIALGQIQPLTDELTPLFGQAEWFMGLQPTPAGKIRTVNTARFVMPERYDERFVETAKYVVSINGVPWGLAVDSVNQPISLAPEDVKWRGDRSKRPWLAGTVKAHMCALLDIPRIGQMLLDADKNRHASVY